MRRLRLEPRPDWPLKVEALGLVWHTVEGRLYWDESACYTFSDAEIERFETVTSDLYRLFVEAGDYVVKHGLFSRFGIPVWCESLIVESWRNRPPSLDHGRFDLAYDGEGPPKLLEFNCDTPTSLLEAAVVQWAWKEEVWPEYDQFNSLHDKLVARWASLKPSLPFGKPVHFAHGRDSSGEDGVTTAYLADTALEAGLSTRTLLMTDVGWKGSRFVDLKRREIRTLFHLYPWEWLIREPFARHLSATRDRTLWIEPIWKMIWSNKAILPILWELYPHHPNLLWATTDRPRSADYARKPTLSREGANVSLVREGREFASTGGRYAESDVIYQGLASLPEFDGAYPVIGSWIVAGEPAGLGIREDGPITTNLSRFVPHIIAED